MGRWEESGRVWWSRVVEKGRRSKRVKVSPTWSFCLTLIGSHWGAAKSLHDLNIKKLVRHRQELKRRSFFESSQSGRLLKVHPFKVYPWRVNKSMASQQVLAARYICTRYIPSRTLSSRGACMVLCSLSGTGEAYGIIQVKVI
ncbi:hypothetical protein ACLB2K_065403 [Fragaria x ananassa]